MQLTTQQGAELFSLVVTVPTITLGAFVVWLYGERAWRSLKRGSQTTTRTQWLIIGITFGFIGQVADNCFWQLAWTMDFLNLPGRDTAFQMGVWFNIVSRQGCGTAAALCHIRAVFSPDPELCTVDKCDTDRRDLIIFWSVTIGSVFAGILYGTAMLAGLSHDESLNTKPVPVVGAPMEPDHRFSNVVLPVI